MAGSFLQGAFSLVRGSFQPPPPTPHSRQMPAGGGPFHSQACGALTPGVGLLLGLLMTPSGRHEGSQGQAHLRLHPVSLTCSPLFTVGGQSLFH